MKYSYHGESLLFYLRKHVVSSDKEAMKLAREIMFYVYSHPENTFEDSVDQYLKEVYQAGNLSSVNHIKNSDIIENKNRKR